MKSPRFLCFPAAFACAFAAALTAFFSPTIRASESDRVRLKIDVDRSVLPAESTEKAIVKIGLDCVRLPQRGRRVPVNLALVIDRSGSMAGEKLESAQQAALEAIRRLDPQDIVSLIAYDSQSETLVPARQVGDGGEFERAIRSLRARGNTALYSGVMRGTDEVRRHSEEGRYVNRVILLSDGLANVGPSTPEQLAQLGAALKREGIAVTTIGLGLGFNEDLMTRLAERSDGNTYFVQESSDLSRIFAAELGDVLSVVARRVVIEIEFPAGVRPLSFVGREGTIRGQRAELALNQLYSGQEKFALIEVEVAPVAAGLEREIASARISYDDLLLEKRATQTSRRTVTFSGERSIVVASADHKLQADYAANVVALAKDEAVALVDADRRDEAAAVIRKRTAELESIARVYGNSAVGGMAAAAAPEADRLAKEGLDNAQRKTYRAESMQARAQQSSTR